MRHVNLILVLLVLFGISGVAKADYYLAKKIEGAEFDEVGHPSNLVKINPTTSVFYGEKNGNAGIYSFDFDTDKVSLLKKTNPWLGDVNIPTGNGYALIDVLGSLYSTDGSEEGTKLLGIFGHHAVFHDVFSNICSLNFQNNAFYFVVGECANPDSSFELWVYRPFSNELLQITNGQFGPIYSFVVDDHTQSGEAVLFFARQSIGGSIGIWRTAGAKNDISHVVNLPLADFYSKPIRTSKGLFFCSGLFEQQSRLLRLSNSSTIDQVTTDCGIDLIVHNDEIYFSTAASSSNVVQALWRSSGNVGDRRLVKTLGPPNQSGEYDQGNIFSLCKSENKLYFGYHSDVTKHQIWESGGTPASTLELFEGRNYTFSHCYDNKLSLYHYESKNNDISTSVTTPFIYTT